MATGTVHAEVATEREYAAIGPWLRRFAWFAVVYNVLVILWGTIVRATGSGAGCGDHWPLCQGQWFPSHPGFATVIEYTHRMMSGPSELPLIVALVLWVFRATVARHLARSFAVAALLLTLNEALLGALLVKLGLTAMSTSPWRPPMLALHLSNTLLLLGALALTAHFLGRRGSGEAGAYLRGAVRFKHKIPAMAGLASAMVIGVTGSLAALGDTLFPSTSLRSALAADFSSSATWLVRLRILHPASAVLSGAFILWLLWRAVFAGRHGEHRGLGLWLAGLLVFQFALGVFDVLLRAPVWMQVLHLAGADAFWCVLVVLTVSVTVIAVEEPHPSYAGYPSEND